MTEFLWQKGQTDTDERIMRFMAGDDVILDRELFNYDLTASQAHSEGLVRIGVLSSTEGQQISTALEALRSAFAAGEFVLDGRFEDGHSAIETYLTDTLGAAGKKIHTGRSRNDQVLVAMRLYCRDRLWTLHELCADLADTLLARASDDPDTPMPGFTHLQHAVVSSTGHWFAGYAEAFIDNAALAADTARWMDANPLGTAAGYGVNLPLDREHTTQALGFARMQINPMYAQNSRGKFELQALQALAQALLDVRRLAWDVSLFCTPEFGFVTLPDNQTTGSSIMPNKRNPDLVELLRASYGVVAGARAELESVLSLPGGYHRDLQMTKGPTMRALRHGLDALALTRAVVADLRFEPTRMAQGIEDSMYATDVAVEAAVAGVPFRDAYRAGLNDADALSALTPDKSIRDRVSPGAPGHLMLDTLADRLREVQDVAR